MEKVVYALWRPSDSPLEMWCEQLRENVTHALLDVPVKGLQLNVADAAVSAAVVRLQELDPQMEAVVSVWVDTAIESARAAIEGILGSFASQIAGYLVTESVPLVNTSRPAALGQRTDGFANLAFLRRPARLSESEWLDAWQNGHTPIAIATQSTFGYVQNVVVRALTPGAPPFDGIVEELFPPEALTDLHVFFDAAGDDERLEANMTAMATSTARFGASEAIDVVPTSQYVVLTPFR